jgi:hypothetical protein
LRRSNGGLPQASAGESPQDSDSLCERLKESIK